MEDRRARILTWAAFAIVLLTDALYVGLIAGQLVSRSNATVPFVASYVLLMAALLGISLVQRPRVVSVRTALRASAAGGLLVLGILAAFSIGLPFIVAGMLATGAAVRTLRGPVWTLSALRAVGAAALSVVLLVVGFEVTERMIFCPAHGVMSGSGYGIVSGGYNYQCLDGRLDFRSGFCASGGGGIDANGHALATTSC